MTAFALAPGAGAALIQTLVGRAAWGTFTAVVSRWAARRIVHYTLAAAVAPYMVPCACVAVASWGSAAVLQRCTTNYPNVVVFLNGLGNTTGQFTVLMAIAWFVGGGAQGPIAALTGGTTNNALAQTGMTGAEFAMHVFGGK